MSVCDKVMLSVCQGHSLFIFEGANVSSVSKVCQGQCKQVRFCN